MIRLPASWPTPKTRNPSKTSMATIAPKGSARIASQRRSEAGRGARRDCLRSGMMTVGPVTNEDAGKDHRGGPCQAAAYCRAARGVSPKVTAAPKVTIRRTALDVPRISLNFEGETALEQDDRHGDRNQRIEDAAEVLDRIDQPRCRPDDGPGDQQQHDRRKLHPPSQPLRPDADKADQRDFRDKEFKHSIPPAGFTSRRSLAGRARTGPIRAYRRRVRIRC